MTGLTLQQVITILNSRVLALEDYVKEEKTRPVGDTGTSLADVGLSVPKDIMTNTNNLPNDIIDEFNERFMMLAAEIANLKDLLLSLQTYTMSINKTLMEERINILSEINMTGQQLHLEESDSGDLLATAREEIGDSLTTALGEEAQQDSDS